jgi:hypothetical protein
MDGFERQHSDGEHGVTTTLTRSRVGSTLSGDDSLTKVVESSVTAFSRGNLVLLVDDFPFKYNFVEVVVFKLIYLYVVLLFEIFVEFKTLRQVTLRESNLVQLIDVVDVIDSKSFFELLRQLFYMFLIAERKNYSRDVMILTSCKLLTHTTDCNDLS